MARASQPWLTQAKLPFANQLGAGNGAGVLIGVIDSGAQASHPELSGQIVAAYNAIAGGTDITDNLGHGTHVSGLLAGTLANGATTQGVASGAHLAMAKVFDTASSTSDIVANGLTWVVDTQHAPIVSMSLGSSMAAMQPETQNAVTKGTLIVAALGNDSKTNGASWPAEFAKATWANGQIIAVGALTPATGASPNTRASFSNYDSTLANWTVYAPGVNIASSYSVPAQQNGYAYMSGTSMATPIVAGQAALIKGNWNFLTAQNIAQIIFQSATRICSDGADASVCATRATADPVYGWGLINIGASLEPIGGLNVLTSSGEKVLYANTAVATPKSGLASGLLGTSTTAVDSFNRGFRVSLMNSAAVASIKASSLPTSFGTQAVAHDATASFDGVSANYGVKASFTPASRDQAFPAANLNFSNKSGTTFAFGTGSSVDNFFGLSATGIAPLSLPGEGSRFVAPFFSLANDATHFGYGVSAGAGTVLRFGAVAQGTPANSNFADKKSLVAIETQHTFSQATALVTVGRLIENNSVMGLAGAGALAIGGNAHTDFFTLAGSVSIGHKANLSVMASVGNTAAYKNGAVSLIDGTGNSLSGAWSLGLAQSDMFAQGDRFGLTVAMPLRTLSGVMSLTTAISQNQSDGSLNYATQAIGLAPTGSERDIELSYAMPLREGACFSAMVQMKLEPGHVAGAQTLFGMGLLFTKVF